MFFKKKNDDDYVTIRYVSPHIQKAIAAGDYGSLEEYCNENGCNYEDCYDEKRIKKSDLDSFPYDYRIVG
jgi:hypothetical protein